MATFSLILFIVAGILVILHMVLASGTVAANRPWRTGLLLDIALLLVIIALVLFGAGTPLIGK